MAEARGGARLFVLAGPDLARSFALGERNVLGRSSDCDVVLRDRSISRKHAVLVREGEAWFVQDLGSTNGVSKDGRRAERIALADGDEFKLGDLPLRLRASADAAAQDIEFDYAPSAEAAPRAAAEAAPARPAPAVPAAEVPALELEPAGPEAELEIEEIEIEEPDAPVPAPGPRARAEPAATALRPPRAARRTGFFAADFEQQPFWLRCGLALLVLALGAGLAYGAFKAVVLLRSGL